MNLWGVSADWGAGVIETLAGLKSLGYQCVEPCVSFEPIDGFETRIWPYDTFRELAPKIRELGLDIVSIHIFGDLCSNTGRLRALAELYGVKQFVVKCPKELDELHLQQTALNYMHAADAIAGAGARLLLHNEAAEIASSIGGKSAYEYLLDLCLGKLDAQVDVGWAMFAGADPKALLWRNRDRVKSLHYKDFDAEKKEAVPGAGTLDILSCYQFARAMGIPQIVDQDHWNAGVLADLGAVFGTLDDLRQRRDGSASYLNILDTATGAVKTLRRFDRVIEAPNWLKSRNVMLYNSDGRIYEYDIDSDTEKLVDTGVCTACNNDHVVAPDESAFAVSHGGDTGEGYVSRVYVIPMGGGEARLVTPNTPSFLHGWSPDGGELAYCAFREHQGKMEVDIYTIPAGGGEEKRLTCGGFNDGPEYSPDGKYIWFNSTRTGLMQIWRMRRDGSEQTLITNNERNNWFAHVSPDGKKVVYLSYRKGDLDAGEHLPNMFVELWLMDADGGNQHRIASLFGGQGSINVNSWSADSRRLAFVSYELL
ncbi:MAG: PD40 domain-containing protein [Oscillospiraceae bacterium]|nr:PD40 domain-containing protein [Oscillospiraceae bacterium]